MPLLKRDPQFVRHEFLGKRKHALRLAQQASYFDQRFGSTTGGGAVVAAIHAVAASCV